MFNIQMRTMRRRRFKKRSGMNSRGRGGLVMRRRRTKMEMNMKKRRR